MSCPLSYKSFECLIAHQLLGMLQRGSGLVGSDLCSCQMHNCIWPPVTSLLMSWAAEDGMALPNEHCLLPLSPLKLMNVWADTLIRT